MSPRERTQQEMVVAKASSITYTILITEREGIKEQEVSHCSIHAQIRCPPGHSEVRVEYEMQVEVKQFYDAYI